jgi:hypothetical protein
MAHLPHWAGITGKTLPNRYTNTPQNYPQSHTQVQYLGYAKKQSTGIDGLQMKLQECPMCGSTTDRTVHKLYRYDNGEKFYDAVCIRCADAHASSLVSK